MAYGKTIENLEIDGRPAPYPVINERAVRAASGIMFLIGISAFFVVFLTQNYMVLNVVVILFWLDFFKKAVFQPHISIFYQLGNWLVKNQQPEYVGVIQKRFAWSIGLVLASIMLLGPVAFSIRGALPFIICSLCLFFMWMETALGICVGCKIYKVLLDKKVLKEPEHRPVCPGGVCSISKK